MADAPATMSGDWQPWPKLHSVAAHRDVVCGVAYSNDGQWLASGSYDRTVQIRRASDMELVRTLPDHGASVLSLAFAPDGVVVACAAGDRVSVWRVADGQFVQSLASHSAQVTAVAFRRDGRLLASGSVDGTVRLWEPSDWKLQNTIECQTRAAAAAASSLTWYGASLQRHAQPPAVESAAFSPDGRLLVTGSLNGVVQLWDVARAEQVRLLKGHTSRVLAVVFAPVGSVVATGSGDHSIRLWRLDDSHAPVTLVGHRGAVTSIAFSGDGELLVSGSTDGTMRIWRTADQKPLQIIDLHPRSIETVAFRPDGRAVVCGAMDGKIRVWGRGAES